MTDVKKRWLPPPFSGARKPHTLATLLACTTEGPNGCREWARHINSRGYGSVSLHSKMTVAHKAAFILAGHTLLQGQLVLHHCDNRRCINPEHLYAGTHMDNMRDKAVRKRAPSVRGEANPNRQLSAAQVVAIRAAYATGITQTRLGALYGVGQGQISRVTLRKAWQTT